MAVGLAGQAKALFEKAFPERQIYHRSGGSVRYVSVSPTRQAMFASGATLLAAWVLFSSAVVLLRGPSLDAQSSAADRKIAKYERWLQQAQAKDAAALSLLEERTVAFTRATDDFERRHSTLKSLLSALKGEDVNDSVALKGDGGGVLVNASIEEADARQSRPSSAAMGSVEVAGFRAKIDSLEARQTAFLDDAEDQAVARSERSRGVLQLTGVGVGRVLEETDSGGPLLEMGALATSDLSEVDDVNAFSQRVREVAARLEEAKVFEDLIHAVPLGAPVGVEYRETSGFGKRTDPFTRRLAWHSGLDMAAYRGAPIITSAPGEVTYAGRKSGYGRVVEVDHGFGFKTRYGHLNSITVKRGDVVPLGQKVGTMGSTGRSTGPHLHYEVWFRGKVYNPREFLRAGKHVHKG
ncbi:MAG: peptidoglycan DD-metalloendopeptidase family protein [Pseudomonadota bacterium]